MVLQYSYYPALWDLADAGTTLHASFKHTSIPIVASCTAYQRWSRDKWKHILPAVASLCPSYYLSFLAELLKGVEQFEPAFKEARYP